MNKPPAVSSTTQEDNERFHLKDKTEQKFSVYKTCFETVMLGLHFFFKFLLIKEALIKEKLLFESPDFSSAPPTTEPSAESPL